MSLASFLFRIASGMSIPVLRRFFPYEAFPICSVSQGAVLTELCRMAKLSRRYPVLARTDDDMMYVFHARSSQAGGRIARASMSRLFSKAVNGHRASSVLETACDKLFDMIDGNLIENFADCVRVDEYKVYLGVDGKVRVSSGLPVCLSEADSELRARADTLLKVAVHEKFSRYVSLVTEHKYETCTEDGKDGIRLEDGTRLISDGSKLYVYEPDSEKPHTGYVGAGMDSVTETLRIASEQASVKK